MTRDFRYDSLASESSDNLQFLRLGSAMPSARVQKTSRFGLTAAFLVCCVAAAAIFAAKARADHPSIFLIHATVFNDQGFTVRGARVRLRRSEEDKWRWESDTDDEGEFAFHVPQGAQYVLEVDAKGYQALTQGVDATQGDDAELTLHMAPAAGGKS